MNRRRTIYAIFTLLFSLPVWAGGALETADITGNVPAPVAGFLAGRTIGIRWDVRMLPVAYSMNASLDPIPNPLGAPVLTLAQARTALQQSLDTWNSLPTSYIQWGITTDTLKTSLRGFDFINELTFRSAANFGAIASSPSVSLLSDATL